MSWSRSGWHLYVLRADAIRLGAPFSVQRNLTEALLGTFSNEYSELEERLRLNLNKPGEWLKRRIQTGDLFREKSQGLFPDQQQAGAVQRRAGVEKLGDLLFPPIEAGAEQSKGDRAKTARLSRRVSAMLGVLDEVPDILRVSDIERAIATLATARVVRDRPLVTEAAASIAHVCRWDEVKYLMTDISRSSTRDFVREAQNFPWEHWTVCDSFLNDRELSVELLKTLAATDDSFERTYAGWALQNVLANAPENQDILSLCVEFALRVTGADGEATDSDSEQIAAFAAFSAQFVNQAPEIGRWLHSRLEANDPLTRGILLQSRFESTLLTEARASLLRSAPSASLRERLIAATIDKSRRPIEWPEVQAELSTSWDALPDLAHVVNPGYWTPDGWSALRDVLRVGGHRGKTASWRLQRVKLVIDALDLENSASSIFDDSPEGLGFLRPIIIDGIGSGDGILANNSVYGLPALARRVTAQVDADAVAAALRAASEDVRIGVAHGAAFVSNYLVAFGVQQTLHPRILEAAQSVQLQLLDDSAAIVQRQAEFGTKQGLRDSAKRASGQGGAVALR